MMHLRYKTGIALFALGFVGTLSLLTINTDPNLLPPELVNQFTPFQISLLTLINPVILLIITIILGVKTYSKVFLQVPLIETFISGGQWWPILKKQFLPALISGFLAGFLLILCLFIFRPFILSELTLLNANAKPPIVVRFLYGGITEEILCRFGLMSLFVFLAYKFNRKIGKFHYWFGIVLAAVLFGVGHLPVVFQSLPNPSIILIGYIIIANSLGGIIFGFLYWKKGLESAMMSHIFAHVFMLLSELIIAGLNT